MSEYHYHTHDVKLEENRAPTDESVKLLNEFEQKAVENIIFSKRFPLEDDNIVSGEMFIVDRTTTGLREHEMFLRFKINGRDFQIRQPLSYKETDKVEYENLRANGQFDLVEQIAIAIITRYMFKSVMVQFTDKILEQKGFRIPQKIIERYLK